VTRADDDHTWFTSTDIKLLLCLAAPRIGPRKLGHFFVACAETLLRGRPPADRSTAHLPAIRTALDGAALPDGLPQLLRDQARADEQHLSRLVDGTADRRRLRHHVRDQSDSAIASALLADALGETETWRWWGTVTDVGPEGWALFRAFDLRRDEIVAAHLPHLRDIAGNPFRPVAFDPAWRTEAVVGLARGMYESRDFAPMPVLADALEDAGCADPDVLAHCRTPGLHVRGCWVVDLVLGKS
jgi:hypothetical protein